MVYVLSPEQHQEVVKDLMSFIHRVTQDKNASPAELSALPEIARTLCYLVTQE